MVCKALRDHGVKADIDVHLMVQPVDQMIQVRSSRHMHGDRNHFQNRNVFDNFSVAQKYHLRRQAITTMCLLILP